MSQKQPGNEISIECYRSTGAGVEILFIQKGVKPPTPASGSYWQLHDDFAHLDNVSEMTVRSSKERYLRGWLCTRS